MSISLKRIQAIFMKDYKEFSRNYAVSIMIIFPLFFAMMYRNAEGEPVMYAFVLNFSLAMLTSFVQACLIAEEKERNTLRSLMMTPASMFDILLGKSTLVFVITAVVLSIATYIYGYETSNLLALILGVGISIILYISVGTICGLYSKSIMEASLSIFPVLIIFTAAPYAAIFAEKFAILEVFMYFPSSQLNELIAFMSDGAPMGDMLMAIGIIAIWTVVLTILSFILYKKRLMD